MFDWNELGHCRENNRIEAKRAQGGLPSSIWQTYSAFANTQGGFILLGVAERDDKTLYAVGVQEPERLVKEFWDTVNNRQKVSASILLDKHVRIEAVDGKDIIVIEVRRADRGLRPVFLNKNPLTGTYRRNGEGDYLCTPEAVKAMMRDSGEKTQDMLVMDGMSLDVFDYVSLRHFRNRMKFTRPEHVWETLEDVEFLQKLGAISVGEDEKLHPTAAGLLMFGYEYEIMREYPNYFLDYQEHYDADVRFTDRIYSSSGEWSGNVCDFFFKAYNKLIQNPKIKIPFKMKDGLTRLDDTPIHGALREALANCVSNADFYGERGLVVRNNIDEIILENPGSFRIELREALSGGVSSPRNAVILKMLNLLNIGERTGSGIPMIFAAWKGEGFDEPVYTETIETNRSSLSLPLVKGGGKKQAIKNKRQKQAITADEASKSKKGDERKRSIVDYLSLHAASTSKEVAGHLGISPDRARVYLQEMAADGIVIKEGENRNRTYRLEP
ncbi:MAG: putative DNA binding domain-containing protein [Clostridiales Family XIII bacterium]|jgi:predicted HTH transcriptional regulator|nr:putative DNA binding domain-containing protein [Clostridiales Family XIII bacterium]